MAIADLARPDRVLKGPPCTVCAVLESLPDAEASALLGLLADPEWRYTTLSDALMAEGCDLSVTALSRHARGRCAARTKLR